MKRIALIGAAGYIAPRHIKAIKETGNELVVAMDINDSVGIMDGQFPNVEFFTEFEQFAAYVEDEHLLAAKKLDYVAICSPNYLHGAHMKYALRNGIDVICEKPLVLNVDEIDSLKEYENRYGAKVNSILQLRLHPSIIELKRKVDSSESGEIFDVDLTYMTSRGKWYMKSWKGLDEKSGGVSTNIGVHFYDMLHFVFGELKHNEVHHKSQKTACGYLGYEKARVKWFLSIDENYLPDNAVEGEKRTYRSITIGKEELEFSGGFTDLHTRSYQKILCGEGYGLEVNRNAIETVEQIRALDVVDPGSRAHYLYSKVVAESS